MTANNDDRLRMNTNSATDRKPNQAEPGCWWRGPGAFSFYLAFISAMIIIARKRGWETNEIEYIRVANLAGDPRIWFWPTDENDPDRIELRVRDGRITANLSKVMVKWKMALPTGQRNRYDVLLDEANESPVGPAVYIHMDKVIATRWDKKKKGSPQQAPDASQA